MAALLLFRQQHIRFIATPKPAPAPFACVLAMQSRSGTPLA